MDRLRTVGFRGALLVAFVSSVLNAATPATTQYTRPEEEPADVPAMKLYKNGQPDAHFLSHHQTNLKRIETGLVGLLFLGDSITQRWTLAPDVWKQHYDKFQPANFGVDGDRTQHVLWRIDNGELDHISPKVVVLMIGTNNSGWPAEQIVRGVTAIVKKVHEKLLTSKVLLLGIFPRGAHLDSKGIKPLREKLQQINSELSKLNDGSKTRYLDIGDKFLDPNGDISPDVLLDGLHPSPRGYQIWADAMQPTLDAMMAQP